MSQKQGLPGLNLPEYDFRLKKENGIVSVFDDIRKKYIILTPEEWVRQNFIRYLREEKSYPASLMAVEKKIEINNHLQRFDLVVYDRQGQPYLIAEFKAPGVKISQQAFDQVVRYNMALKVSCILVSNGLQHFACRIDYTKNSYSFLKEVPAFEDSPGMAGPKK